MMQISLLLGGMMGPDGWIDSAGMLTLRKQLAPLVVDVFTWNDYAKISRRQAVEKFVLIGYSGGGTRAIMWANWQHVLPVDLMVLYDPSPSWQMEAIGPNVAHVITYQNSAPDMPVPFLGNLGGGVAALQAGNTVTKLERVMIAEQHLAVQNDAKLHAQTVAAVKALASQL